MARPRATNKVTVKAKSASSVSNSLKLTNDLCYLLGALRDGCITANNLIKFKQRNRGWLSKTILPKINVFFELSLEETQIYKQQERTTRYYLAFKSKRVHSIFKNFLQTEKGTVPKVFHQMSETQKRFFIQGFWDAEGGCPKRPSKNKKMYINFTQKDPLVLEEIKKFLEANHIKCGRVRINDELHQVHCFSITDSNSMSRFISRVSSQHPEKMERLSLMKTLISFR